MKHIIQYFEPITKVTFSIALLITTTLFTFLSIGDNRSYAVIIDGEEVPLHHISATECKMCHAAIYDQWKGSMHAKSTALKDPIHRTFYKKVMGDPLQEGLRSKKGQYPVCLKCHAPNAAQDKKTKLDTMPAYSEGVNCLVCHRLKSYKGTRTADGKWQLGIDAYEVSNVCQGPSGFTMTLAKHAEAAKAQNSVMSPNNKKDNPHTNRPFVSTDDDVDMLIPLESNPSILKTSAACLGCHDKRPNSKGVLLCQTGDEYLQGKTHVSCQSCHMPISGGFADHTMGGGHNDEMLKRALFIKLETKKTGDTLEAKVLLHNQQPHKVPTGAPFRNMSLKVTAYDADGFTIWTNFKKHPAKEDPKSYFHYQLKGADGKPSGPPKAVGVIQDTRMLPYEKRKLIYTFPAKDVALVRVEMYYSLLWKGLVNKMSFLPKHLKEAKRIAFAEKYIEIVASK